MSNTVTTEYRAVGETTAATAMAVPVFESHTKYYSRTATVPAREFLFATEVGVTTNMADLQEKAGED